MSESLARTRCLNHHGREAVARCPECHAFYCRECVTEHAGRVLCVRCLNEIAGQTETKPRRRFLPALAVQAVVGFFLVWFLFTVLGEGLAMVPHQFHDGAITTEVGE